MMTVSPATSDEWATVRAVRLAAAKADPAALAATYDELLALSEDEWRALTTSSTILLARSGSQTAGIMRVSRDRDDFGATCWISDCWVDPEFRGQGVLRALFAYVDAHAHAHNWLIQGLGVFVDNHNAFAAYEALGFTYVGEVGTSTRRPPLQFQRMIRTLPAASH